MKNWAKFIILSLLSVIVLSCSTPSRNSETNSNQTTVPPATFQQQTTQTPSISLTPEINTFTPAQEGTLIPTPQKEISIDNISQVIKLARWGNGFPRQAVYSPDGKFIVLSTSIGVRVYSSASLELIRFIETSSDIGSVAISPDGTILAAGGRESLLIYKMSDGILIKTIEKGIQDLDFSPDGRFLAVGIGDWNLCHGGEIELWNVSDWTLKQNLANDLDCVGDVIFSPSGKYLAIASYDVLVWEINGDEIVLKRKDGGCAGQEVSLAFTFDERFLVSGGFPNSGAGVICLQSLPDGKYLGVLKKGNKDSYSAPQIVLSPDGKLLAITQDNTLTLWQPNPWKVIQTIENISNATWSPDGKNILSISNAGLQVLSIENGKPTNSVDNFSRPITRIAWYPNTESIAIDSYDKDGNHQIVLWQIQNSKEDGSLTIDGPIDSFALSPNGEMLAVGFEDDKAQIWDFANNALIQTLDGALGYGKTSVDFSDDGSLLALDIEAEPVQFDTENVQVWDTKNWHNVFTWEIKEDGVIITDVDISPDKKFVAASSYKGKVRLWSLETGNLNTTFVFANGFASMKSVSFSPNGEYLASATIDGKVGVWDTETQQLLFTFESSGTGREQASGDALTWSPNGQLLVIGARDGEIFLISSTDGKLIRTLKDQTESISGLVFSPDGKMLVSASEDGTICLWGLAP